MARPKGTKNTMRTPEEKEALVLEHMTSSHPNYKKTAKKYGISKATFHSWIKKYRDLGIEGLKNQIGKNGSGNPLARLSNKKNKTKEEELELENLKLKVEVARLKKGTK